MNLRIRIFSNSWAPPGILIDLAAVLSFGRNGQPHVLFSSASLLAYLGWCLAATPVLCIGALMHLKVPRKLDGSIGGHAQTMNHHCIKPKYHEASEKRHG